jgi:hypothetical protein
MTFSAPAGNGVLAVAANGAVSIIGAGGPVAVTAVKAADTDYSEASATVSIAVARRAVTVTADDKSKAFGAADPALTWTANPPLVGSDTLTGSLTYTGTQIGSYDIVEATPLANPTYAVTFVKGVMTITQSVTAQEVIDRVNALPNPVLTWADADLVAEATNAYDALAADERDQLPQAVADRLAAAQNEAGPVNHADTAGGGSADSAAMPWNVRLRVVPVPAADARRAAFAGQLAQRALLALYDISLVDTLTGQPWQLPAGAAVNVTLTQVNLAGQTGIGIAHQLAGGGLETIAASVSGAAVTFTGTSFSLYGVTAALNALATEATAVPTLNQWTLVLLALLLVGLAGRARRKA